jgi:hypothetical protein
MRLTSCILLAVSTAGQGQGQVNKYPGSLDTPVVGVDYTNLRAIDVFQAVASRYHVTIGLSGLSEGDDSFHINVGLRRGTIRDLLDAISREDARYHWELRRGGSIAVTIGALMVLPDLRLQSVDIERKRRLDLAESILPIPEVTTWLKDSGCLLDQITVFAGTPRREGATVSAHVRDEPLWVLLNAAAASSGQYFWSLVEYTAHPCRINLQL